MPGSATCRVDGLVSTLRFAKMTRAVALVALVLCQAAAFVAPPSAAPAVALTPRQGLLEPYGSQKQCTIIQKRALADPSLHVGGFQPIGRYPRHRTEEIGWLAAREPPRRLR